MESLYPNNTDENGFLFYPIERIEREHMEGSIVNKDEPYFIFVDYMQRSWAYYFKMLEDNEYEIGIRPFSNYLKPITNSLSEFIEYYLNDSDILYKY